MNEQAGGRKSGRGPSAEDRILASILLFEFGAFSWNTFVYGESMFGSVYVAFAMYGVLAMTALILVRVTSRVRRSGRRRLGRLLLSVAAAGIGMMLFRRGLAERGPVDTSRRVTDARPTAVERASVSEDPGIPFALMAPDERSEWALRVMLHRFSGGGVSVDSLVSVPREWRFPEGVEIAIAKSNARGTRVWARADAGVRVCLDDLDETVARREPEEAQPRCREMSADEERMSFFTPRRSSWAVPVIKRTIHVSGWPQYRGDAGKSGGVPGAIADVSWSAKLEAGARASGAIVGDAVLVGTHGAGSLEAFAIATGKNRWRVRLPNWVHQDPISDGSTVVVGFGDKDRALSGRAPAGVAAYDLASGRLLWTAFERFSVMTSPVIEGHDVAYVTSSGVLRKRRLSDGALQGTLDFGAGRGGATMSPPAVRHDTMVTALEYSGTCVVDITVVRALWCTNDSDMRGSSGPTILGDTLILSVMLERSRVTFSRWISMFGLLPMRSQMQWLRGKILGERLDGWVGQGVRALDLRTGATLWSHDFVGGYSPWGHTSGTATANDRTIVITLPLAGKIVAIDRKAGAVAWTAASGFARGPGLIHDGRLYHSERDGRLRVFGLTDGAVLCSIQVPRHFDRGGPARAGNIFFFASTEGDLTALPQRLFDDCAADSVRAVFARPRL